LAGPLPGAFTAWGTNQISKSITDQKILEAIYTIMGFEIIDEAKWKELREKAIRYDHSLATRSHSAEIGKITKASFAK